MTIYLYCGRTNARLNAINNLWGWFVPCMYGSGDVSLGLLHYMYIDLDRPSAWKSLDIYIYTPITWYYITFTLRIHHLSTTIQLLLLTTTITNYCFGDTSIAIGNTPIIGYTVEDKHLEYDYLGRLPIFGVLGGSKYGFV